MAKIAVLPAASVQPGTEGEGSQHKSSTAHRHTACREQPALWRQSVYVFVTRSCLAKAHLKAIGQVAKVSQVLRWGGPEHFLSISLQMSL